MKSLMIRISMAIVLGSILSMFMGCAAPQKEDVETVGTLVRNDTHVYQKPVHKTTDLKSTFVEKE